LGRKEKTTPKGELPGGGALVIVINIEKTLLQNRQDRLKEAACPGCEEEKGKKT